MIATKQKVKVKPDKEAIQTNTKAEKWNGHLVKVKRDWQLTKEIEEFYIRSQILIIADRAQDNDWELAEELTDRLMTFLYDDELQKKGEIESEFWEWATDFPGHYLNHRIVNQVIEVKKEEA